jgi:hypothetical protein
MMGGTIGFVDKEGPGCLVRVQLSLAPPLVPITESPSHVLLHAPIPRLLRGARVILAMPPVLSRRLAEKWLQERGFDLHIFSSVEELMDGIHSGAQTLEKNRKEKGKKGIERSEKIAIR